MRREPPTIFRRRVESSYRYDRNWRWRLWTKLVLAIAVIGLLGSVSAALAVWSQQRWTTQGCFTVTHIDLRAGYADTGLYTTIGVLNQNTRDLNDTGKWLVGDRWCGPIHHENGATDWVRQPEGRLLARGAFVGQPTVGDGP